MICNILSTIEKYKMINKGDSIAVGFSGGADSVCLLHFLSSVKDEYDIVLKAVHINHNIRGEEALRDEKFASDFCKKIGVEFVSFSVDVPKLAKETGKSEEECGRDVRYECFKKLCTDKIAVAHTLSDSAETVLFNLARGTGMKGLCGISPVRDNIIRPLIECTRKDIELYCEKYSLTYVTDSTNLCNDYTRNKLRHQVIPVLKNINPAFEKSIQRLTQNLTAENEFIETEAEKLLCEATADDGYLRKKLLSAHKAVIKRAVSEILSKYSDKDVEEKHTTLCLEVLLAGRGAVEFSKGIYFCADNDKVFIKYSDTAHETVWCFGIFDNLEISPFDNFEFEINSLSTTDLNGNFSYVDISNIDVSQIKIRSRKTGDKLSSSKRKNTKTLKKLFIENKIPKETRNKIAVISYEDDVLWVDNFGTDSKYEIKNDTEKVLIIKKRTVE